MFNLDVIGRTAVETRTLAGNVGLCAAAIVESRFRQVVPAHSSAMSVLWYFCWRSLRLANVEVMEYLRETFAQRIWMCAREFFLSLRLKVLCWLVSVEVKARKLSSFVAWSVQRGVCAHVTHLVCMRQG